MQPSQNAINLVKASEGLRLTAYPDPASGGSPWTIGYGATTAVHKGDVITQEQADAFLGRDLAVSADAVNRLVKVPLSQCQMDALVSFVYNLGGGRLAGSTLLRLLNQGRYSEAARQFPYWVMGGGVVLPGLVKRRSAERALFERTG